MVDRMLWKELLEKFLRAKFSGKRQEI